MSTGLTYVNVLDTNTAVSPTSEGFLVFQSYQEAYKWGEWYTRLIYTRLFGVPTAVYVTIYTTGPNQNGYWPANSPSPTFVPFD